MAHTPADTKALPDSATLAIAAECVVRDATGGTVKFGAVFEGEKTVVVFIRHFFSASCQGYVEQLASVPENALTAASAKIVVIGCGEWEAIAFYAKKTAFTGLIYADPTHALYRALGMTTRNAPAPGQEGHGHVAFEMFSEVALSTWRTLTHPSLIGKQGNWFQLGGDFVLGPGLQCGYASRMRHAEDHVRVAELMRVVGVYVERATASVEGR